MLVRSYAHQQWELVKWMVLLVAAIVLTFILATGIAGAKELAPPGNMPALLPGEIETWSTPMEVDERWKSRVESDLSMQVWQAIDAQHREE